MKSSVLSGLYPVILCLLGSLLLAGICIAEDVDSQQLLEQDQPIIDEQVMMDAEKFILEMQQKMMLENQKIMQPKIQQAMQEKMQQSVQPRMLSGSQGDEQRERGKK